jgi:hypothetical protein
MGVVKKLAGGQSFRVDSIDSELTLKPVLGPSLCLVSHVRLLARQEDRLRTKQVLAHIVHFWRCRVFL